MPNSKAITRKHLLELRSKISDIDAKSASLQAAGNFVESVNLDKIKTIALYQPMNGEISPLPIINLLIKKDVTFCLPVVTAKNAPLEFHAWKPGEPLINNELYPQLLEPKTHQKPIIPDIIIVPLVAFDKNLHRIGYGAGFYDRTIQGLGARGEGLRENQNPSPLTVGYAFELQKCPPIKTDSHDIKLDVIVTDKNIYSA